MATVLLTFESVILEGALRGLAFRRSRTYQGTGSLTRPSLASFSRPLQNMCGPILQERKTRKIASVQRGTLYTRLRSLNTRSSLLFSQAFP